MYRSQNVLRIFFFFLIIARASSGKFITNIIKNERGKSSCAMYLYFFRENARDCSCTFSAAILNYLPTR